MINYVLKHTHALRNMEQWHHNNGFVLKILSCVYYIQLRYQLYDAASVSVPYKTSKHTYNANKLDIGNWNGCVQLEFRLLYELGGLHLIWLDMQVGTHRDVDQTMTVNAGHYGESSHTEF